MKKHLMRVVSFLILISFILSLAGARHHSPFNLFAGDRAGVDPQSEEKPKYDYDYMSSILNRSKPLGLKENLPLRRFLNQPPIKWTLRSEKGHILN